MCQLWRRPPTQRMPKQRENQPKCGNCKGPHVANYKGCPAYRNRYEGVEGGPPQDDGPGLIFQCGPWPNGTQKACMSFIVHNDRGPLLNTAGGLGAL